MNKSSFKNILAVSLITGGILGVISLIPFVAKFVSIVLLTCISIPLVHLFKKLDLIGALDEKSSLKFGALIGIYVTLGFGIIFTPLVYILNIFIPITYLGGFSLMVKLMSFSLALLFIFFLCIISAIFNAFSTLMYYYVSESIKNLK